MRRGEVWTVSGGNDYDGKPRPCVVLQDDSFDSTDSITICIFATHEVDAPLFRLAVQPNEGNGLHLLSWLMVDKIATVPRGKLGRRLGKLGGEDMLRLNRSALVFLGLASPRIG